MESGPQIFFRNDRFMSDMRKVFFSMVTSADNVYKLTPSSPALTSFLDPALGRLNSVTAARCLR